MLLLRYLLMFTGIGLLAGAAGILVWDLYQILKSRKARETAAPGEDSILSPELPQPTPVFHWQASRRLATWGVVQSDRFPPDKHLVYSTWRQRAN